MMASTELVHQDSESSVSEELELLRNVYTDEMSIMRAPDGGTTRLKFHLTPSTADDKEQQYVYLDLCLCLPALYPQSPPTLSLLQSRGLADAHLTNIQEGLCELCSELLGCPMVYQLVEWVKESLTSHNRPCGQCALCLSDFTEDEEEFRKTECYHYFHTLCLLRYVSYHQQLPAEEEEEEGRRKGERERVVECPVCRETIPNGSVCLRGSEGDEEKEEEEEGLVFVPSPALREWQRQMVALLERQKERGGVIDLGDKDTVIDETWVRAPPTTNDDSGRKQTEIQAAAVTVLKEQNSKTNHSRSSNPRTNHSSSSDSKPRSLNPRTRDYSSSNPRTRDSSYSDPRTRDYSYSDPRTRDYSYSDPRTRDYSSSNPRTNHSSYSDPRTRDYSYSDPRTRDYSYSDPKTRDYSSSNPRTNHSSSSDPRTRSSNPRTRDYSSSNPRTRDYRSSDLKSHHSRSSDSVTSHNSSKQYLRTNHSSYSDPRTRDSSYSDPRTRDSSYSDPRTRDSSCD